MSKRFFVIIMILFVICMTGYGCGNSSAETPQNRPDESVHREVVRLDEDGYLYYMDYTKDYYGPEVIDKLRDAGFIDTGCSTFFTHNTNGDPITCRNYDYPHRVSEEDRSLTGLNIVLHTKPEGKYESIAMADAVWCDSTNPLLQRGGPDMPDFDAVLLDIIPYECSDGINEKGLSVSILYQA